MLNQLSVEKIQAKRHFVNVVLRISGKTFKFNQNDPAITLGRHDWNVFVARCLNLILYPQKKDFDSRGRGLG